MYKILVGALVCAFTASSAHAALVDRGGGMIYDDVLAITWLQDANFAATQFVQSGGALGDADGRMNWAAANTWAANLSYYDSARGVTYDDWRLPTALNADGTGPCSGFNCSSSEFGHMFYNNMGAGPFKSILSGSKVANLALFSNLQSSAYWSGSEDGELAPDPRLAWYFATYIGSQGRDDPNNEFYAWAVRSGDVAAPVPLPAAGWLLLAGLGGLGLVGRRRKAA